MMYNGSRNETLEFFPAICFTTSDAAAEAYGQHVHEVAINRDLLKIKIVEMTAEEMREAIDDQEWPCDRDSDIESAIASGYDAVVYTDCDDRGRQHDCLRILTLAAFTAAVTV